MATTLLKIAADTQLSLAAAVTVGQTTATLSSASDPDGTALPSGKYGFTVDGDTSAKEYIVCDLVGTALTNVQNITRQGVSSTGFANYHRVGATVTITDWAILSRMLNNLNGTTGFDSGTNLGYDGAPAGLTGNQFATVNYVLSVVNGGAVSFDQQVLTNQTSGEALTIRDHVYLKTSDAKWYKVDADDSATFIGVERGIALSTVSGNSSVSICISGPTSGFTGLTAGAKYYASSTAGAITATIPSAPAYETLVGVALSTTSLLFAPLPNTNQLQGSLGIPSSTNKFITQLNTFATAIDQSQTTGTTAQALGEASTTGLKNLLAQSFIPTTTKIRAVSLYKSANTGTFTGTVKVAIQADSAGNPSGSDLTSVTITNAVYNTFAVGEFLAEFASDYTSLTIGSTYWIVVTSSTSDTANHPNLGSNAAGGYANGAAKYFNAVDGWVAISSTDLYFKTFIGTEGQIPAAATTGLIPFDTFKVAQVATGVAGTSVTGVTTETTSFSGTIDSTILANAGRAIRINTVQTGSFNGESGAQTNVFALKIGGVTVASLTWGAASTVTGAFTALVRLCLFTNADWSQSYILEVTTVTTSGTLNNIPATTAYGNLSTPVPPGTASALITTFDPSANGTNFVAQTRNMLVEQL